MRRSVGAVVSTVGLIAGLSAPTLAVETQDDTQAVCAAAQETVENGLETFVRQMNEVSESARAGDLQAAEAGVREAGSTLTGIAGQLREDSAEAEDAQLKQTATDLAAEFDRLGGQLEDLTGLQEFDTARLDELADDMAEQCGGTPSSGATVGPKPSRTQ